MGHSGDAQQPLKNRDLELWRHAEGVASKEVWSSSVLFVVVVGISSFRASRHLPIILLEYPQECKPTPRAELHVNRAIAPF